MFDFKKLIQKALNRGASDFHLKVGNYPHIRVQGELIPIENSARIKKGDTVAVRKSLGIKSKTKLVLFVGFLVDNKGVTTLAQAIKNLREEDVRLVCIGEGPLKKRLAEILPSIKFTGILPHGEVAKWMQAADVLVLPSKKEGFGLAVVEAMACSTSGPRDRWATGSIRPTGRAIPPTTSDS